LFSLKNFTVPVVILMEFLLGGTEVPIPFALGEAGEGKRSRKAP